MNTIGLAMLAVMAVQNGPADVDKIMARVAANQRNARAARAAYVYRQEQVLRLRRPNGKVAREQRAEYVVTPVKGGSQKRLTSFAGKYELKGKLLPYDQPGFQYKGLDVDGELIQQMADDMMNDQQSRDGLGHDLFPLTAGEQKKYDFRLVRTENYRGRMAYRVAFAPRHGVANDDEDPLWKGEAVIDAAECQPVLVTTSMAEKVPLWVKVVFGTDIRGLGFSVTYQKFAPAVWFPVSYGGEFAVRGLFFYQRKISVSMVNSDFRKTNVTSTVAYGTDGN